MSLEGLAVTEAFIFADAPKRNGEIDHEDAGASAVPSGRGKVT
jgi:hypothetical protein